MVEKKAAFVSGMDRRIPTAPISDGFLERVVRLAFHIQNQPGVVPTIVTRDSATASESTHVPQQAFLMAPMATICHLSPGHMMVPASGCPSGDSGVAHPGRDRAVVPAPISKVDVAGVSLTGYAPGYKDRNQDSALLLDTFLSNRQQLLAVFDGHGPEGHRVSTFAKRNLPYTLLTQLIEEDGQADNSRGGGARCSHREPGLALAPSAPGPGANTDGGSTATECGPIPRALWRTVTSLDQQLEDSGIDVINSGTTAALCHVHGRRVTAAWVGDSRMLVGLPARAQAPAARNGKRHRVNGAPSAEPLGTGAATSGAASGDVSSAGMSASHRNSGGGSGGRWHVAWSSTDHKPELPEEARRIEAAGGRVARSVGRQGPVGPYRVWFQDQAFPGLAMSRALGDLPGRDIGVTCTPSFAALRLPDSGPAVLVLASDGVWELMSNEQVLELAAGAGSAAEAASRVVQQSRRAWIKEYGGSYVDDITALVMRFDMSQ